jgi:hypothetical protein
MKRELDERHGRSRAMLGIRCEPDGGYEPNVKVWKRWDGLWERRRGPVPPYAERWYPGLMLGPLRNAWRAARGVYEFVLWGLRGDTPKDDDRCDKCGGEKRAGRCPRCEP